MQPKRNSTGATCANSAVQCQKILVEAQMCHKGVQGVPACALAFLCVVSDLQLQPVSALQLLVFSHQQVPLQGMPQPVVLRMPLQSCQAMAEWMGVFQTAPFHETVAYNSDKAAMIT